MIEDLTTSPEFDIRYTEMKDEKYLKKWLLSPGMLKCFPMSDEKEVEDMVKNWIGFSRFKCSLTTVFNGKPTGIGTLFLMPFLKVVHHCMLYFIVDPDYQNKGMGTTLIRNLKHLAKNYFRLEMIHLDVFEGCKAYEFLKKLDFHELARQEKFILNDDGYQARILMETRL